MVYFEQTSDEPYDRHSYELEFNSGKQSITFEDYEHLRAYWFECVRNWGDCKVNVLDRKQKKKKTNGGFK
tara:strand:- start:96 stop:305 length:210 start_codon:yes stop_codon:yes gene_type:complete